MAFSRFQVYLLLSTVAITLVAVEAQPQLCAGYKDTFKGYNSTGNLAFTGPDANVIIAYTDTGIQSDGECERRCKCDCNCRGWTADFETGVKRCRLHRVDPTASITFSAGKNFRWSARATPVVEGSVFYNTTTCPPVTVPPPPAPVVATFQECPNLGDLPTSDRLSYTIINGTSTGPDGATVIARFINLSDGDCLSACKCNCNCKAYTRDRDASVVGGSVTSVCKLHSIFDPNATFVASTNPRLKDDPTAIQVRWGSRRVNTLPANKGPAVCPNTTVTPPLSPPTPVTPSTPPGTITITPPSPPPPPPTRPPPPPSTPPPPPSTPPPTITITPPSTPPPTITITPPSTPPPTITIPPSTPPPTTTITPVPPPPSVVGGACAVVRPTNSPDKCTKTAKVTFTRKCDSKKNIQTVTVSLNKSARLTLRLSVTGGFVGQSCSSSCSPCLNPTKEQWVITYRKKISKATLKMTGCPKIKGTAWACQEGTTYLAVA